LSQRRNELKTEHFTSEAGETQPDTDARQRCGETDGQRDANNRPLTSDKDVDQ